MLSCADALMILLAGHLHTISFHSTFTGVSCTGVCSSLSLLRHCVRFSIFPHAARPSRGSSVSCRTEVCESHLCFYRCGDVLFPFFWWCLTIITLHYLWSNYFWCVVTVLLARTHVHQSTITHRKKNESVLNGSLFALS